VFNLDTPTWYCLSWPILTLPAAGYQWDKDEEPQLTTGRRSGDPREAPCDGEVLPVLAEDMEGDGGRVEVVWVAGVVPRLVPRYPPHAECWAAGGWRVLDLDEAAPRHQLPVVLPNYKFRGHDGLANDTLEL